MATISGAVAGLVTLGGTVQKPGGGTLASYDLKTFFDAVAGGSLTLPCMLAVEDLGEQTGWQTMAMMGSAAEVDFVLFHYLLYKVIAGEADITLLMPDLATLRDNYLLALIAQPFLTPATAPSIHLPPKVRYQTIKSKWGETVYHGIVFRLDCHLNL